MGTQPDEILQRGEGERIFHRDVGDVHSGGQEAVEILERRRFAGTSSAVEDETGAAGRQHDLRLDLADDRIARDECLLLAVHRVAGNEHLGRRFALDDGAGLPPLFIRDDEPSLRGGAEFRGDRFVQAGDAVLKILDIAA